jgi:cellobiose-specific phosphotransferase system component IIC
MVPDSTVNLQTGECIPNSALQHHSHLYLLIAGSIGVLLLLILAVLVTSRRHAIKRKRRP